MTHLDLARASALNEDELWREMVRWSGGQIVEDEGVLLVIGAFVAYMGAELVACAMTLVSHRVAGVFYVATVEHARRRGLASRDVGKLRAAPTSRAFRASGRDRRR